MDIFREAGFAVYPILVFGVLSLRWAGQYARGRDGEARFRWLVVLGLTLAFGVLGSATGLQASVQYITTTPDKWLFLVGLRESLHNLSLAVIFAIADLLLLLLVPRAGATANSAARDTAHAHPR